MDFERIADDRALARMVQELVSRERTTLAMDFEGEFNLHEYGCRLCLIQVFDGSRYYILDPFALSPEAIKAFLEDGRFLKIFYGADSDRSLVHKQYGAKIKALFDLKLAVDILGLERRGLDAVLAEVLGIESSSGSKKRYQMHNWTVRPIEAGALQYALGDVGALFSLRSALLDRILAAGKAGELIETLARRDDEVREGPPGIFKTREFRELRSAQKARFTRLFELREETAKAVNLPPNLVVAKEVLFSLAKGPGALAGLKAGPRMPPGPMAVLVARMSEVWGEEGDGA